MRITFHSDGNIEKKGFNLNYFMDEDECLEKNGGCHHKCVNTVGSYVSNLDKFEKNL